MGFLSKIGKALKEVGRGAWWALRRPETQVIVNTIWPASLLTKAISLVKVAEHQGFENGQEKKEWVISLILEVAARAGINKRADLEKLVEDALAVVERRAHMVQ